MIGFDLEGLIFAISVWTLPIIVAITFHEAAHGYVAWRLGDDTALLNGRVSSNPARHVDPFGFLIILVGIIVLPLIGKKLGLDLQDLSWLVVEPAQLMFTLVFQLTGVL